MFYDRNIRKVFLVKAFDYKFQQQRAFIVETPDFSHTKEQVARYGWEREYALGVPQLHRIEGTEEIFGPHEEREPYRIWELPLVEAPIKMLIPQ